MPAPRDPNLLLAAARAYYLEGKSQAEIAVSLETSRSNVSRMLTEAQRQGIVEIKIHDPSGRVRELELALRKKFGLKDVLVAASRAEAPTALLLRSASLAHNYSPNSYRKPTRSRCRGTLLAARGLWHRNDRHHQHRSCSTGRWHGCDQQ
ncbi:MAG: hypothetical protein V9E81_16640 [Marmoricola sp.]